MKVRVYTIGVGTQGGNYQIRDPNTGQIGNIVGEIDEKLLTQIAVNTGGKYFKASNNTALKNVFNEIDKMEKTKIEVSAYERKSEMFLPYALIAFALFFLEILLRYTIFRSIP
jgi:Ca-activated chloride channel family protein